MEHMLMLIFFVLLFSLLLKRAHVWLGLIHFTSPGVSTVTAT